MLSAGSLADPRNSPTSAAGRCPSAAAVGEEARAARPPYHVHRHVVDPRQHKHLPLLFQALELMFDRSRKVASDRIASFVSRLAMLQLYLPPSGALACLHFMRIVFHRYPRVSQLLDLESTAPGAYLPELADPDHANAFSATSWQVLMQAASYHQPVRTRLQAMLDEVEVSSGGFGSITRQLTTDSAPLAQGRAMSASAVMELRISPAEFAQRYDTSQGQLNPAMVPPNWKRSAKQQRKQRTARRLALARVDANM